MSDDDDDDNTTMTTTMDEVMAGDSDGEGCLRLFQSTARFDRVMGDAADNQRHRN